MSSNKSITTLSILGFLITSIALGNEYPGDFNSRQLPETSPEAFSPPPVYESHDTNRQAAVHIGGSYMKDEGRGHLLQIASYRDDLGLAAPLSHGTYLTVTGNRWQERTLYDRQTHRADGITVGLSSTPSEYISGTARWTTKRYDEDLFSNTDSGGGTLSANIFDRATASVGFERTDAIYNYFGMLQGIQADNWWMHLSSDISSRLEINGTAKYTSYSDSNNGMFFRTSAGYAFTDHPRIFKIEVSEEYRDTRDNYLSLYFQDVHHLVNIIHPYWCPRDYTAQTLTFDWTHNLSAPAPIPARQHFYTIRTSFIIDSESNPATQVSAKWYCEIGTHLTAGISAMLYRSKEWDADSASAEICYRF